MASSTVSSLAGVQLEDLAPDQSTTTSDNKDGKDDDDVSSDDDDEQKQSQEDISTMETSSSETLSQSLSWSLHLQQQQEQEDSQAESTTVEVQDGSDSDTDGNDNEEDSDGDSDDDDDDDDDDATPRATRTQFVFTTNPFSSQAAAAATTPPALSSPPSLDRSLSWLHGKTFPPPLVPSSKTSTAISELISTSLSSSHSPSSSSPTQLQLHLKATSLHQQLQQQAALAGSVSSTTTQAAVIQGEAVNSSTTPISSPAAVGASQLPLNATPFIYQLAATPAQSVGIRQSVLTPILTFLPNAQGLVAAGRQVGTTGALPQPVILSPPGQALGVPLASSATPALMSSLTASKVTNGAHQQPQKSIINQSLNLSLSSHNHHILSTEPTTGQQTLKSPVIDAVTSTARNASPPRTLASIPLSEMTPQYSELKAFAEEFKNKRIRLGFTQGAVGQSLADKGYSNFAQSTISRFEQMQLSPTNAAAIKLVLEKWLQETENPEAAHSPSSSSPMMASRKRKRRAVFTPQTKTTLETYFKQNPRPNRHIIESVANELDLLPEEVRVWFCNKRQKEKQGSGCGGNGVVGSVQVAYKYPSYERESSVSLSSSGANSPSSMYDNSSFSQKRNTPSPPRNTTPFTIEELSKSSSMGTKSITSPMCIANPFATSPQGVVMALTTPRISFTAQPVVPPPPTVVLPQLRVSQTTA